MTSRYPISAYDRYICLKMSPAMWGMIIFLSRAVFVFAASIASKKDRMGIINMFYGERFFNVLGILAAVPAIMVLVAWIKRSPETTGRLRQIWRHGKEFLLLSTALNVLVVLFPVLIGDARQLSFTGMVQLAILAIIAVELVRSPRVRDTFADYPEPAPPDPKGDAPESEPE